MLSNFENVILDRCILLLGESKGISLYQLGLQVPDDYREEWFDRMLLSVEQNSIEPMKPLSIYKFKPVDIKEFIESPFYLDKKNEVYPVILNELIQINSGLYEECIFVGGIGSGKALDILTPIPVPLETSLTGWKAMGDLKVGDKVYGADGKPCTVTNAFDILHNRPCYELIFSDNSTLVADADHLWLTHTYTNRASKTPAKVKTTKKIFESLYTGNKTTPNQSNHAIPVCTGLDNPPITTYIDPYTFGAWLGDGSKDGGRFWTADNFIRDELAKNYLVTQGQNHPQIKFMIHGIARALRYWNVLFNKHIPDLWLRASYDQRFALLQGLMDTDGTIAKKQGVCSYTSVQYPLAVGVFELVKSLGFRATMLTKKARCHNGRLEDGSIGIKDCGVCYQISFSPQGRPVFRLPRKLEYVKSLDSFTKATTANWHYIRNVKEAVSRPVRCITVDSPDSLFLAGKSFIPTHNSTAALYTQLYQLYLLSCMKNPHTTFGLDPSSEIVIAFQSINFTIAKRGDYGRFKHMVEMSPYFKEHFPFDTKIESRLLFPHRIEVVPISGLETAAIGQNIISILLEEVNFMAVTEKSKKSVDGAEFDQAAKLYNSISKRRESRFLSSGRLPGIVCIVSSKRYPGQFTDTKEEEAKKQIAETGRSKIYIYDKRIWDVKPDSYCGVTFDIFVGDEGRQPRILGPDETIHPKDRNLVDHIPIELKHHFERDMITSLRDIAGRSTLATHPFIMNTEAIMRCMNRNDSIFSRDSVDFVSDNLEIYPENFYRTDLPRYAHIDLGLTGDSAGLTIGTITGFERVKRSEQEIGEILPNYYIDGTLEIRPPKGGEILFWKIRNTLYALRDNGLNIRWVSWDTFQCLSTNTLVWTSEGYKRAGTIKVGDVVQSRIGARPITSVFDYGVRPCLKITTTKGHEITCTGGHKLEASIGHHYEGKLYRQNWGWVKAEDMKVGDVVRIWLDGAESSPNDYVQLDASKEFRLNVKDIDLPSVLTENLALAIGIIWGDGSFNKDTMSITIKEGYGEYVRNLLVSLFGRANPVGKYGKGADVVSISSCLLTEWFEHNGLKKAEDIPDAILQSPVSVQCAFIKGLFSTDGCVGTKYKVTISNTKKKWLNYVQQFCALHFGMRSCISKNPDNSPLTVSTCYNLYFGDRHAFYTNIGAIWKEDIERFKTGVQTPQNHALWVKVASIEATEAHVVDFEVEEDHAYIANGFVSHNSKDSMQIMKQKGFFTGTLSADTSMLPYEITKSALYDGRISMPFHEKLRKELASLEVDVKRGKIDHPPNFSKDLSDSLSCVCGGLISRREIWGHFGIPPSEIPESVKYVVKDTKDTEKVAQRTYGSVPYNENTPY